MDDDFKQISVKYDNAEMKTKTHSQHKHRIGIKKIHETRSKSCGAGKYLTNKKKVDENKIDVNYLKIVLQKKDEQIGKLIQKITDLQLYNAQFSQENDCLTKENNQLQTSIKILSKRFEELQNHECKTCKNWEIEKDNLFQNNEKLSEDVVMLKILVHRLNIQLERYQDKFCEIFSKHDDDGQKQRCQHLQNISLDLRFHHLSNVSPDTPYNWGDANSHTLGPLLNAYEEMIKEKDFLLEQHENELYRFTGQFKMLISENNELHQQIDDIQQINEKWKEEKIRMKSKLEVYVNKAEIQTKRADMAKEKLKDVLRCYEHEVQSQSLDLERLQELYSRAKGELITLKHIQKKKKPEENVADNLKEYQKLFGELKIQYNNERKKLSKELLELKKSITKIQDENMILKHELDDLKQKNNLLKQTLREMKKSRDRLKICLRNTLQWLKNLEEGNHKARNTWNNMKELEVIVEHKDAQIRGLQAQIEKLQEKLQQKDQIIKDILKKKSKVFK